MKRYVEEIPVFGSGVDALYFAKSILNKAKTGEYGNNIREVEKDINELKSMIIFYNDWD